MDFMDVTQVIELTSAADVNKHLALGWKLVNVYTTAYDTMPPGCYHQTSHYVLAWTGENPQYPPSKYEGRNFGITL